MDLSNYNNTGLSSEKNNVYLPSEEFVKRISGFQKDVEVWEKPKNSNILFYGLMFFFVFLGAILLFFNTIAKIGAVICAVIAIFIYCAIKPKYTTEEEFKEQLHKITSKRTPTYKQDLQKLMRKTSKDLLADKNLMIHAVELDNNIFDYAASDLRNDMGFIKDAILANECVFAHLTQKEQMDENIVKAYLNSRLAHSAAIKIDGASSMEMSKYKNLYTSIDEKVFAKSYGEIIENGVYNNRGNYSAVYALALDCMLNYYNIGRPINSVEEYIWEQHAEKVLNLAATQPRVSKSFDEFLVAAEKISPKLREGIEKNQKQYWSEHVGQVADIEIKKDNGQKLTLEERSILENGHRYIDIEKIRIAELSILRDEQIKNIELLQEKEVIEPELAEKEIEKIREAAEKERAMYLKQDGVDMIYSLSSIGVIDMETAQDSVSRISGLVISASQSRETLAKINDIVNDYANKEFGVAEDSAVAPMKERIKELLPNSISEIVQGHMSSSEFVYQFDPKLARAIEKDMHHGLETERDYERFHERVMH